jgi:small subunit ribosomal protein S15
MLRSRWLPHTMPSLQWRSISSVARLGLSRSFQNTQLNGAMILSGTYETKPLVQQQVRYRWTKAKKKRTARFQRRQELLERGIELPKPPYYFPRDTPVVNANTKTRAEQLADIKAHDERVSAELHEKLVQVQAASSSLLRHHMSTDDLVISERVRKLFDLQNGSQREVIQAQKHRGMEIFQRRPGDTGSSAVQVIALTTRIQQLQTHMATHKKDKHSKRGMDALFIRRRKTLDYLERKDFESYRRVVKILGLVR